MSVHEFHEHFVRRRISTALKVAVVIGAIAGLYLVVVTVSPDVPRSARAATAVAKEPPKSINAGRGFDYFPDHYQLQAREPTEPVASF
jgi:hypothetical protein